MSPSAGRLASTLGLSRPDGNPLVLGPRVNAGGEGEIFAIEGEPTRVVKKYRRTDSTKDRKLRAMLKAVPDDPQRAKRNHISICWPEDLVLDQTGRCVGFEMPRLDIHTHRPVALFWNPEDRATYF